MKKIILLTLLVLPLTPTPATATEPSVRINEIAWMGTAVSASDEWLELYNNTDQTIDLTGWSLVATDGSPSITLAGGIEAFGYFLLERTDDETVPTETADAIYTGALSNTSEYLKLLDASGVLIDEINSTAGWLAGDNTTKQTMERVTQTAWVTSLTAGGTPRQQNSATENDVPPAEEPGEEENDEGGTDEQDPPAPPADTPTAKKGDIVINELLPNPLGIDVTEEFIELKNVSVTPIDITNWEITTAAGQKFIVPSLIMTPNSMVILYRQQTGLAFNNLRDTVTLKSTGGTIIDRISYKPPVVPGKSFQRDSDGTYHVGQPSPNKENVITKKVLPIPRIDGLTKGMIGEILHFDGSDSFDPENRPLQFRWDFGDGRIAYGMSANQVYTKSGSFTVSLIASTDQASSTATLKVVIAKSPQPVVALELPTATSVATTSGSLLRLETIPFIFISEFLPNPEGSDTEAEFIELFNQEGHIVDLSGWQLDDAEGGSKPFTIAAGTTIKPNQYKAFFRDETGIALNNSNDEARLIAPGGIIIDRAPYEKIGEGKSFVLDEIFSWQETSTPSPGELNVLDKPDEAGESKNNQTATTTGTVLGATNVVIDQPKDKTKVYLISGISAMAVMGFGAILTLKKRHI